MKLSLALRTSLYFGYGVLTVLVLARSLPYFDAGRDAGVFLYVGQQILSGHIPYRDIWDHKGPVIYYIDALGLAIAGNSRWGIWLLEFASLYLSAVLSHTILSKRYGILPAMLSTFSWLGSIPLVLEGGNFTEEFALPLQFLALYLYLVLDAEHPNGSSSLLRFVAIGVLTALAFFLRPNMIGIPVAIMLAVLVTGTLSRQPGRALTRISQILIGFALLALPLLFYFILNNAFIDFVDAVFLYNTLYVASVSQDRIQSLIAGLMTLGPTGLSMLGLSGWFGLTFETLYRRWNAQLAGDRMLLTSLFAFPLEILLSTLSGRTYAHYYLSWLAATSLCVGWLTFRIGSVGRQANLSGEKAKLSPGFMVLGIVLLTHVTHKVRKQV